MTNNAVPSRDITPLPTLFVSHGAPTFALEPGKAGAALKAWAAAHPKPRAIVVVSPHWMTRGLEITTHPHPETIHDFGGFPRALYALRYPAPGAPGLAVSIIAKLADQGLTVTANPERGWDHGVWTVLMNLYPAADIPVAQISLPATANPKAFLQLGEALASLREEGILIVASGCITHNLYEFRQGMGRAEPYAVAFMDWFAEEIAAGHLNRLLAYRRLAPEAARAHPTDEHLLPIFVAMGAAGSQWQQAERIAGGVDFGVIGMDSYAFGIAPDPLQNGDLPGAQAVQPAEIH